MPSWDDSKALTSKSEVKVDSNGKRTFLYTQFQLNWLLRVTGVFTTDGLMIQHVTSGGPATKLINATTNTPGQAQVGDIISSINDQAVLDDTDWAQAIELAPDHSKLLLSIIDVNTGNSYDWFARAQSRPGTTIAPTTPTGTPVTFPVNATAKADSGDTTATVTAKISKQSTKGLIELTVKVKKTGISGEGFAYGQVALVDVDGNTLFKTDITQKHVGADLSGAREDDTTDTYDVPLNVLSKAARAVVMPKASDDNGLPHSLEDFTNTLKQVEDLIKVAGAIAADIAAIIVLFA